ncbi:MAG TPA: hypothetical protein VKH35_08245 [Thermoanaerobaculia bacterium]|jgi:hypothetical protein|nr:hypothetical protein [Thermoanaerobaculia bacterium]
MKTRNLSLGVVMAVVLAVAAPLAAFTLVEAVPMQQRIRVARGATFTTQVNFTQAALCDGSVKLAAGPYNVQISSMGDGSVHAIFLDRTGRKAGEAHGIIAVLRPVSVAAVSLPAVQHPNTAKSNTHPAPAAAAAPILNFQAAGFLPNSRTSFSQMGPKLNLEISSHDGSQGILIGLLLPAVIPAQARH